MNLFGKGVNSLINDTVLKFDLDAFDSISLIGSQDKSLFAGLILKAIKHKKNLFFFPPTFSLEQRLSYTKNAGAVAHLNPNLSLLKFINNKDSIFNESLIFFTSGSSGNPKGIIHNYNSINDALTSSTRFLNFNDQDIHNLSLPLHNMGGFAALLRMGLSGGSFCFNPLESTNANCISVVEAQLNQWCQDKNILKKLISMKSILVGGSLPTKNNLKLWDQYFSHNLILSYGSTESGALILASRPPFNEYPPIGEILPNRECIVDQNSVLGLRKKGRFIGSLMPNGEIKSIENLEIFQTNDKAISIEKNKVKILGRNDLTIISGGKNIDPITIENKLKDFFQLKEAILVSNNHDKWGQELVLFSNPKLSAAQVKTSQELESFEIPKHFFSLLNGEYKINRSFLKRQANQILKNESKKKNIVLLHGFFGDSNDWNQVIESLNETNLNLFPITIPGHDSLRDIQSDKNDECLKIFLNELATKINEINPEIICGYSLGGRLALKMIYDQYIFEPAQLILIASDPGVRPLDKQQRLKFEDSIFSKYKDDESIENFLEDWYNLPLFNGIKNKKCYKTMVTQKTRFHIAYWRELMKIYSPTHFNFSKEKFLSLNCKLTYMYGESDIKYKELGADLKSIKPDIDIIIAEDSSHNIPFQMPDKISTLLSLK